MTDEARETGLADTIGGEAGGGAMVREVIEGLSRPSKRISSKYHYDERGSELFAEITRLDEYYPTRMERALLEGRIPAWVEEDRPASLVELGAGNAEKSRIILDAMLVAGCGEVYVPVDVSHDFLRRTADALAVEYPSLTILPVVDDITAPVHLPELPHPTWIAFLGSTLGNFEDAEAVRLLEWVRAFLGPRDRFLLGVDLRPGLHKSAERIELAYNDVAGITAAFSLNVLAVLNAEIGTDFDLSGYRHRAVYSVDRGRIETDLISTRDQVVRFPEGTAIRVAADEAIRTEISCKYDRSTIHDLFERAGLEIDRWVEDDEGFYALILGRPSAS